MSKQDEEHPVAREPEHGSTVVYRHDVRNEQERHRIAVVVGPVLSEPVSGQLWVGVQLPRPHGSNPIDLIAVASIIGIERPDVGEPRDAA